MNKMTGHTCYSAVTMSAQCSVLFGKCHSATFSNIKSFLIHAVEDTISVQDLLNSPPLYRPTSQASTLWKAVTYRTLCLHELHLCSHQGTGDLCYLSCQLSSLEILHHLKMPQGWGSMDAKNTLTKWDGPKADRALMPMINCRWKKRRMMEIGTEHPPVYASEAKQVKDEQLNNRGNQSQGLI